MAEDELLSAANTLEAKAQSLVLEQNQLRLRIVTDAIRDREISQNIGGCIAGAAALGFTLELHDREVLQAGGMPRELKAFLDARAALTPLLDHFAKRVPPQFEEMGPVPEPKPTTMAPAMPKLSEVVLERLRAVGEKGMKAVEIRNFILATYHSQIHEKSVGMTLYRLQVAGEVRRDGHIWFLASPEAKNPGAVTPGPKNARL